MSRTCPGRILASAIAAIGLSAVSMGGSPTVGADSLSSGGSDWAAVELGEASSADLPGMRERKQIRALVTFSKTDFFLWRGRPRGFETELMQQYESFLNRNVQREDEKVRLVFIPVPFSRLLPALLAGEGDIVAAGLTVTPERQEQVAFTDAYLPDVDEVVVTSESETSIDSLRDLSGRRVYVLRGSSYSQHLRELSETLEAEGGEPIEIVEADEHLGDADILELVNAGIVELTVVDSHLADLWSKVFTKMVVRDDLRLNEGGRISWAVRKSNRQLLASLNEFVEQNKKGTRIGNILFTRYFENDRFVKNPLARHARRRLDQVAPMFERFAERYDFDWLAIAAQAYQESGFDHSLVSPRGAFGIMQVLPSTAADPQVGIDDISSVENNIHAAVKYLAFLRDRYYASPSIDESDRLAFLWAAYNAGPEKVREMRKRAGALGLDPNRWFLNVEHVAQGVAGVETVRHVANTYKYYIAYRLSEELLHRRAEKLDAISNAGGRAVP